MGHVFGSGMRRPAHLAPTRVSANACAADDFDAYDEAGQGNFDMALRFGLNPPRELAHCFLTALSRVERWTGFYECELDAMARDGGLHHPDRHGRHAPQSRGARR